MLDFTRGSHIHLGPNPNHSGGHPIEIAIKDVSFWYGAKQALKHVSIDIFLKEVIAFIGPSGCGKSTLLRCLNRTNELIAHSRMEGCIRMDGADIYADDVNRFTIVIVTHNLQQAARVAQRTAFFHLGEVLEVGDTEQVFIRPQSTQCLNYITGRYG